MKILDLILAKIVDLRIFLILGKRRSQNVLMRKPRTVKEVLNFRPAKGSPKLGHAIQSMNWTTTSRASVNQKTEEFE